MISRLSNQWWFLSFPLTLSRSSSGPGALPLPHGFMPSSCPTDCSFSTSFGSVSFTSQSGHQMFPLYIHSLGPHPVLWLSITPTCQRFPTYLSSSGLPPGAPDSSIQQLVKPWISTRYVKSSCPNLNLQFPQLPNSFLTSVKQNKKQNKKPPQYYSSAWSSKNYGFPSFIFCVIHQILQIPPSESVPHLDSMVVPDTCLMPGRLNSLLIELPASTLTQSRVFSMQQPKWYFYFYLFS